MSRIIPSEYQECAAFYQWAQTHPICREYLIHHVNEGKRSIVSGSRLNRIGMRKGLPDYQLPIPNGFFMGLWIEMKMPNKRNHKKNEHQDFWIEKLLRIGHYATYCYGWEDARDLTLQYLNNISLRE